MVFFPSLVAALLLASAATGVVTSDRAVQLKPDTTAGVRLDVPYLSQTEAMCGGAAVAMLFRYWGDTHADIQQFAALADKRAGGIAEQALVDAVAASRLADASFCGFHRSPRRTAAARPTRRHPDPGSPRPLPLRRRDGGHRQRGDRPRSGMGPIAARGRHTSFARLETDRVLVVADPARKRLVLPRTPHTGGVLQRGPGPTNAGPHAW